MHAARVAPEKADFRPALLRVPHAGLLPEKVMSTYSEKLKDPRWQRKRLEILNRDDFTCRGCGSKEKTLHVHHMYYLKGAEPWEYHNNSLFTYCFECHDNIEQERYAAQDCLLHALYSFGANYDDLFNLACGIDFSIGVPPPETHQLTQEQWELIATGLGNLIERVHRGDDITELVKNLRSAAN